MSTSSNLSIASMNCRGLGNYEKRRDVFHFLKNKVSLCCLQDVHFKDKMEAWAEVNGVLIAISVGMQVTPGESHFCSVTKLNAADCVVPCPFPLFKSSLGLCKV